MTDHPQSDSAFVGSVPEYYERFMVPLLFQTYADDLARRICALRPTDVLEVAAGSGVVTRSMASELAETTAITATDLNQPMLDHARTIGTARPVEWRQADVMALPFADDSFDAVACQFAVMFFPDKVGAHAEIARVLRPGGSYVFSVWDRIEENDFVDVGERALAELFPDDPPMFMSRTPHGYHDQDKICADLGATGAFTSITVDTVDAHSHAPTAAIAARAYVEGTPLRGEIEARDPAGIGAALEAMTAAIADRFGATDPVGRIRAFVVTATR